MLMTSNMEMRMRENDEKTLVWVFIKLNNVNNWQNTKTLDRECIMDVHYLESIWIRK